MFRLLKLLHLKPKKKKKEKLTMFSKVKRNLVQKVNTSNKYIYIYIKEKLALAHPLLFFLAGGGVF